MLKRNIFISYKVNEERTAEVLALVESTLVKEGFEVWRDVHIEPGAIWSKELYTWLMECSGAIVLLSEEAAKSEWCRREWWFLRERHRTTDLPVIPVTVDGSLDSAGILDEIQTLRVADGTIEEIVSKLHGLRSVKPSAKNYLAAHHAWLRWQFGHAPLWNREPFSLGAVYVETDCGVMNWGEISGGKQSLDPFDEKHGGRHNLVEAVIDRMSDPAFRDIIVVQGPPGCGKSAFALRLANELLSRGLQPILARFRDFRFTTFDRTDELIEDALRIGPIEEEPPRPSQSLFEASSLDRTTMLGRSRVSELVFILDGWDEVSLTGSTSYQAQLQTWLPKIREFFVGRPGPPVRVILTGRPSAEVRSSGILRNSTPILTIRCMTPTSVQTFAGAIAAKLENGAGAEITGRWRVDLNRLKPIFARYQEWFDAQQNDERRSYSMEVLGSPLLAFLTFRTLADWPGDPSELTDNHTALYKVLIDITVAHAGKTERDEQLQTTVHRGGEQLRRLLHKVASVISILGQEAVSFTELDARLQEDRAFKDWYSRGGLRHAVDDVARKSILHELIVNFYFKGGNTGIGCELLHKSFREYLFAEAIVTALKDQSEGKVGPLDQPKVAYWQDFAAGTPQLAASRTLSLSLASQWLTREILSHLTWLLAEEIKHEPGRWIWLRDLVLDVYIWWAEGVHLRPQPRLERGIRRWDRAYINDLIDDAMPFDPQTHVYPVRLATLDANLGGALMQITAIIHAELIEAPREMDPEDCLRSDYRKIDTKVRFAPGGKDYFKELCARINSVRSASDFPTGATLPSIWMTPTSDGLWPARMRGWTTW